MPAGGPVRARTSSWRSGTTTGAPGSQAVRRTTSSAASSSSGSCSWRGPPAGVEAGPGGEGDRAAADPHREEVGVGGATLPEAVGLVDDRPERRRVGVEVLGDGELGGGQVVGLGGDLLEVGEVAGPVAAPGPAGGAALDQAEPEPGHHRGDGGPDDQGDQPRGPGPGDREQERDRPATPDQRHQVLQPTGGAGGGPPHRRRGGDRQLDRRQRRRMRPHRPVHQDREVPRRARANPARAAPGPAVVVADGGIAMTRTLRRRPTAWAALGEVVDNRPGHAAGYGSMIVWKS